MALKQQLVEGPGDIREPCGGSLASKPNSRSPLAAVVVVVCGDGDGGGSEFTSCNHSHTVDCRKKVQTYFGSIFFRCGFRLPVCR